MKNLGKRVVCTGIGIISPIGIGLDNFWEGLESGADGVKSITFFDVSKLKCKKAGEITNFEADKYLEKKGLRYLNRTTKLLCSAAKLALDDSNLAIEDRDTSKTGVVIGATLGAAQSMSEFDIQSLKEGPRYVNPMEFPNTVSNSPAAHLGIKYGITGFNTTISSGQTSSLQALNYGVDFLKMGRVNIVLAGGSKALSFQIFLGFYKIKLLSNSGENSEEKSAPFDKDRNGVILSEGSAVFVLEELEHALNRKAKIYAEVIGFANVHDAYKIGRYNAHGEGAEKAMEIAIMDAQIKPEDIDFLCANANGSVLGDRMETMVINKIFGDYAQDLPICSIKSMVGESYSASGSMQIAASILAMSHNTVPPTLNFKEQGREDSSLKTLGNIKYKHLINVAMINSFDCSGDNASIIIKKFEA